MSTLYQIWDLSSKAIKCQLVCACLFVCLHKSSVYHLNFDEASAKGSYYNFVVAKPLILLKVRRCFISQVSFKTNVEALLLHLSIKKVYYRTNFLSEL